MRVRSRGVDRCVSHRTAYEQGFFSARALFPVSVGQSQPGRLAFGTAGGTQPTKAVANAERRMASKRTRVRLIAGSTMDRYRDLNRALRSSLFSPSGRSFRPGPEIQGWSRARALAHRTLIFDIFRHLHMTTPGAAAGDPITTVTIDSLVASGAITPSRRRLPSSPVFPATELSQS
jgi:hypothetical protein